MFDLEPVFYKLIELVHVDIHEELRGEVAEGEAHVRLPFCVETVNHIFQQPKYFPRQINKAWESGRARGREDAPTPNGSNSIE